MILVALILFAFAFCTAGMIQAQQPQVVSKPLSWFKSRAQPRKGFSQEELQALGMSMISTRQLQPLVCLKDGTIICGERRYRAGKLVGMTHLNVTIIEEDLSEVQICILQLIENMQREDLTSQEKSIAIAELKSLNHLTNKDIAEQLKIDPSMVTKLLAVYVTIPAVQQAYFAGRLGATDVYAISKHSEAEQAAMLEKRLNGATRDELERAARQSKNGTQSDAKTKSIRMPLPSGAVVTVAAPGDGLTMQGVVDTLSALLSEARAALKDGVESKSFAGVCRDKAAKGG